MAIGTITLGAIAAPGAEPPVYHELASFAGDATYATGGTAGFQTTWRAKVKQAREVLAVISQGSGVYFPEYDKVNDKLRVRKIVDGTEVGNATDLSGTTFNVLVISK